MNAGRPASGVTLVMKKPILVALIAATALVPIAASAQEWQGRGRGNRGGDQAQQQRGAERPARATDGADRPVRATNDGTRRAFDRDSFQGRREAERAQRVQQPAAPVAAPQAVQPQRPAFQPRQGGLGQNRGAFRNERRDDRQDFRQERREDRGNLANGTVTPQAYRQDRRDDRQDYRRDRRDDRQDVRRNDNRNDRNVNRGGNWGGNDRNWNRNDGNRGGSWNRNWRSDRRYDWSGWRNQNRNQYRLPRYYAPRGYNYGYQRFGIGVTLGAILFSQNYWINDPWEYRLPAADGPYRWVRYYNDALLVDTYSGEVVDVIYDIFW